MTSESRSTASLDIELIFDATERDLDAELFDPDGNRIAFLYESLSDEQLAVDVLEAGEYTLRIFGWEMPCAANGRCDGWTRPPGAGEYRAIVEAR